MAECTRDDSTDCDCERCQAGEERFWAEQGGARELEQAPHPDALVTGEMDHVVERAYKRERDEARQALAEIVRDRDELSREVIVLQRKLAEQQDTINRMRGAKR